MWKKLTTYKRKEELLLLISSRYKLECTTKKFNNIARNFSESITIFEKNMKSVTVQKYCNG